LFFDFSSAFFGHENCESAARGLGSKNAIDTISSILSALPDRPAEQIPNCGNETIVTVTTPGGQRARRIVWIDT
jgi:hypothetical protein